MYIDKWWGDYLGGTDDTCTLLDYFKKDDVTEYPLSKIFKDFNINSNAQSVEFRDMSTCFYYEDGIHHANLDMVINMITDLSAILLECLKNKTVSLKALDEYTKDDENKSISIIVTANEYNCLIAVVEDFVNSYMEYQLAEFCGEDDMKEIATHCNEICEELKSYNR